LKKQKTGDEDEEDEDEDEEYESDESSYNSEEEAEGQEFEEICPTDVTPAMWSRILQIRENRLDQEEKLLEVQKNVELLKKENDALLKKERIIDAGLKNTKIEIQEFQTQKQRKLNELDVVVTTSITQIPLRFSQIQHIENNNFPADISPCIVFTTEGLEQLKARIKELHEVILC
jgi:hypothetical protein